jgi:hypothetical protein
MSVDTVKPKGMLIDSYDCLSQILIAPAGFESEGSPERVEIGQLKGASQDQPLSGGRADISSRSSIINWLDKTSGNLIIETS